MNLNNNVNQVSFGSNLILSKSLNLSKKIDKAKLAEDFAKRTSRLNDDFVVSDSLDLFGVCAQLNGDETITGLKIKKISDQEVLLDKLIRAYKMLVTDKKLDNVKSLVEANVIKSWIKEYAGADSDLQRIANIFVIRR